MLIDTHFVYFRAVLHICATMDMNDDENVIIYSDSKDDEDMGNMCGFEFQKWAVNSFSFNY